uniref:Putative conserved phosducin-like protein n=1 Tax=Tabanus bromius TaxID=304241 RepID=A0A0K8TME4_TABBR
MATLEDKILGEKLEYYCSSSEDEGDEDGNGNDRNSGAQGGAASAGLSTEKAHWSGTSQNTGPKGVIEDWQKYKQMESEQRMENERSKIELMKKLSITAKTAREDEERKKEEELEKELAELLDDDILLQFQKQRMAEMLKMCGQQKSFGTVLHLKSREDFLNAVEKEPSNVSVLIHIYEKYIPACTCLNECLDTLAADYKSVKFCKIAGATAGMSLEFKSKGLPAILIYKANQLIGNFVRLTDELGEEFYPSDLESFLIENGMLFETNIVANY